MDFDSLTRRDLQFFCKKNKIPANMTNIAMADALKALEIVEGIDEFTNQSPTSIAKNLPSASRTAARRKTTKYDTQSSELVTRSCFVTSKSLAGEMDQENKNTNMHLNPSVPQSRRRAAATSVAVKLDVTDIKPEASVTKKDETVQRVYSTRRSVRLLEESIADLTLKTKDSLNVHSKKNEDAERQDSPAGSKFQAKSNENSGKIEEAETLSVRDLNDSLEMEWDGSKNDPDLEILYGDLGDITFFDASTTKEQMNGIESNKESDSFVLVEEQETSQEDDFVVVDHAASSTVANIVADCNKESESEQMKIDSESESEETEYETDPWEGNDFGTNKEAFESKVSATDNASKVDSVTTVLIADESKELDSEESKQEDEEICESGELIDSESEDALVSDKKKTQASPPLTEKELEVETDESEVDSDEWSDFDVSEVKLEENSCESEESVDIESEETPVSDKKTPATSSSTLSGKETKTPLSPFEAESILESDKNKENFMEMVVGSNGEEKADAEAKKTKKKTIDEESFKDVSMRQLTKMVKELAIKSKQQHKCDEESFKDVSMRQLTKMVKELAIKSKQQHKCADE